LKKKKNIQNFENKRNENFENLFAVINSEKENLNNKIIFQLKKMVQKLRKFENRYKNVIESSKECDENRNEEIKKIEQHIESLMKLLNVSENLPPEQKFNISSQELLVSQDRLEHCLADFKENMEELIEELQELLENNFVYVFPLL